MKLLVTGAHGFIGNHLIRELQNRHEVFALARKLPPQSTSGPTRWIEQDLNRPLDYARLPQRVDAIIHLAQSEFYKQFPERADDIFNVNTNSTFQLLEYGRKSGAEHFVFTSTVGVYGYGYEKFI